MFSKTRPVVTTASIVLSLAGAAACGGPGERFAGGADGMGHGPDGGLAAPRPGDALVFRPTRNLVLVDTADPAAGACGAFAPLGPSARRLVVDLDACGGELPAETAGLVGSVRVVAPGRDALEVRVAASDARSAGAPAIVGPRRSDTQGFLTRVGADRAFAVEVSGAATAHVRIEASAILVPESAGGAYVHLLERPERWFASNPNDAGFRDVWPRVDTVLRYPVLHAERGASGMFGAVHLGPAVWRTERVAFHMGAARSGDAAEPLTRWASVPEDGHFPWRYSTFFFTGASAAQEIELGASAGDVGDAGPEPWVDAVGWLSEEPGLVLRPLDRPLDLGPVVSGNEEDVRFETGLGDVEGVLGSIELDLPRWPHDEQYRWFFVMVGAESRLFPGALGGGLEGPDWMTAGLNQNGRVSVRFVTRTADDASFVMRHYAFLAGGGSGDPSLFAVEARVRIDGVLTSHRTEGRTK